MYALPQQDAPRGRNRAAFSAKIGASTLRTSAAHQVLPSQQTFASRDVEPLLEQNTSRSTQGHDFSRVPIHPPGRDFQQAEGGAAPGGEEHDVVLDQQPTAAVGQVAAPATPANVPPGGPNPPAGPQQAQAPVLSLQPTVTFNTRIRSSTTPASMAPDRIPPRVDFPVGFTVTNWRIPMLPIQIGVDGSGGNNGTVTVDGAASSSVTGSGTVQLRGTAQTAPGNAGNLRLVARFGGQQLAASNTFSVAAIPQDMVLSSFTPLTGNVRGFRVTQTWSSDSGNLADLNEAQVSEAVEYVSSTGVFSGLGARNSGYLAASGGSLTDTHSTPVAALTGPGTRVANQTEMFLDNRTAVRDVPMRNSGFIITRNVALRPPPAASVLDITTSKAGATVTANGIASSAGSGSFSVTQQV